MLLTDWSKALLAQPLLQAHPHWRPPGQYVINVDEYPIGALNATAWSLIYTYPLTVFANFAGSVLRDASVNEIVHARNLASPDDPSVLKPNVDTLYSRVVLDLSSHDVVLTVPEIDDGRYWVYPVYDPYGNVISEIGVANDNRPGKYLIRRADDVFAAPGYGNSTSDLDSSQDYQGIVNLPGSYATMLIRLLVLQNTTADLDTLHAIQDGSRLETISRDKSSRESDYAPALKDTALNGSLLGIQTPFQQLEFAARLVAYNQPIVYSERFKVASILAQAGLYNNRFHPRHGANLHYAAKIANASITSDVLSPDHVRSQGNGYYLQIPEYQGVYGKHYASAAYVALAGYQEQTTKQTLYPGFQSLGFASVYRLPQNSSWLFTFSGKPKVRKPGFWSLSVYGSDQYLIKNPIDRFEVGDRTYNLTYPDGESVYGPDANHTRDGPFHILLQSVHQPPPANWTSNWLPGEQTFFMLLRWYFPEPAMTNGSYVYPKVENITAIIA